MASARPLLKLAGVSKDFIAAEGAPPVRVLHDIHLDLAAGESLAIVGPSGSGKSTLLNIIGTLDQPTAGTVELDGRDVSRLDERETAVIRNRLIGFVFQSHHLLPHCSVIENVLVPTLAAGRDAFRRAPGPTNGENGPSPNVAPPANPEDRARRLLDRVGLGQRLTHRPTQLSGGERQRVAVVRALINQPKLLLADEPTGALDRASAEELAHLLGELNREQGVTLIVVTHAPDLARQMGRLLEIREGTLKKGV